MRTILDIPIKYRMKLKGKYNAEVTRCFCGSDDSKPIGFSECRGEVVIVKECQECYKKFYHHVRSKNGQATYLVWLRLSESTNEQEG